MALTVSEMFKQYAGRDIDSASADYWGKQFGSQVDPGEIELFKQTIVKDVLSGKEKAAFGTNWWNSLNFDQKTDLFDKAGATPEQLQSLGFSTSDVAAIQSNIKQQKELDQWVYTKEPKGYQDLYRAVQSGSARIGELSPEQQEIYGTQYGVFDSSGKLIPEAQVDPNTGTISVGTSNGVLRMSTAVGPGGTLAPVAAENYLNQVQYESFGHNNDLLKLALGAGTFLAAPWLAGQIGSATGLTGAGLTAATGATIGGTTGLIAGGDLKSALKGALLGGVGGYVGGSLFGGGTGAPAIPNTDAGFIAADAAQLAAQGLSEAQIAATLNASGYASTAASNLAASMAANGVDAVTMANQLQNLSSNTGLFQQNLSQGSFGAYDALNLRDVVGNDFAAIEQNLVASGMDPLVAADISQQLAFNPNITQAELATNLTNQFGNNIYDVDMAATYPTSVLPGEGGLLEDVYQGPKTAEELGQGFQDYMASGGYFPVPSGLPEATYSNEGRNYPTPESTQGIGGSPVNASTAAGAATTTGTGTGAGSTITPSRVADIIKAGLAAAAASKAGGLLSGGGGGLGGGGIGAIPTQGIPEMTPGYYRAIQQYYNAYMPNVPRDVATPLQQWYENKYGA